MYYQGGPEIQADGLQTLYLMNPNNNNSYNGYSDTQPPPQPQQQSPSGAGPNMLILNYATGNTLNVANMVNGHQQHQHQHQHLLGVPLQAGKLGSSHQQLLQHHHQQHEAVSAASRGGIPHFHQSLLWGSVEPTGLSAASSSGGGELGFHRSVVSPTQQGLSLSLSPQQPVYGSLPMDHNNISMHNTPAVGIVSPSGGGNLRGSSSSMSMSVVSNNGLPGVVLGSKYLKAAQQLLDELVSVGKGMIKAENIEKDKEKAKSSKESMALTGENSSVNVGPSEIKPGAELSTAQKQEIQMKKAKLISMLDEVEQRYRQYHQQMQIVVATFEQATGIGSARSYTQLALQTISKQFRCLKDAISAQIKAASKSLGEEEALGGKIEGSRLKFVDQQLRQQRALQHLGMMQSNAWRPQRGLPERAVSVLRAWLFEHFLHPYPKDSDKQMLAKQTGLTRSQVSNWFINARVRLWKPMVEEMYSEEMKNQEEDGTETKKVTGLKSNTPKENNNAVKTDHQLNTLHSKQEKSMMQDASPVEISNSSVTLSPTGNSPQARANFGLVCALNMEGNAAEKNPKKLRTHHDIQNSPSSILSMDMEMKFGETRKGGGFTNNPGHGNGFGAFTFGDLSQFNPEQLTTGFHGNGVSLTLGLPPSENLPISGSQQNFLSDQNMDLGSRLEMGTVEAHFNKPQAAHSSIAYETIDFENRKRFAAPLLPDFVA